MHATVEKRSLLLAMIEESIDRASVSHPPSMPALPSHLEQRLRLIRVDNLVHQQRWEDFGFSGNTSYRESNSSNLERTSAHLASSRTTGNVDRVPWSFVSVCAVACLLIRDGSARGLSCQFCRCVDDSMTSLCEQSQSAKSSCQSQSMRATRQSTHGLELLLEPSGSKTPLFLSSDG